MNFTISNKNGFLFGKKILLFLCFTVANLRIGGDLKDIYNDYTRIDLQTETEAGVKIDIEKKASSAGTNESTVAIIALQIKSGKYSDHAVFGKILNGKILGYRKLW